MTKQEFDIIVVKANLTAADNKMFDIVTDALNAIKVLDDYEDMYEEN